MRTRVVSVGELDARKGLRAKDYVPELGMYSRKGYLALSLRPLDHETHEVVYSVRLLAAHCFATAVDKGWWEKYDKAPQKKWLPEIVATKLALVHSELSEGLEEVRNRKDFGLKPYFSAEIKDGLGKPEGLAAELADAVIRIFDLSAWLGLDIAKVIEWKMAYNKKRSHKHGGKAV